MSLKFAWQCDTCGVLELASVAEAEGSGWGTREDTSGDSVVPVHSCPFCQANDEGRLLRHGGLTLDGLRSQIARWVPDVPGDTAVVVTAPDHHYWHARMHVDFAEQYARTRGPWDPPFGEWSHSCCPVTDDGKKVSVLVVTSR